MLWQGVIVSSHKFALYSIVNHITEGEARMHHSRQTRERLLSLVVCLERSVKTAVSESRNQTFCNHVDVADQTPEITQRLIHQEQE